MDVRTPAPYLADHGQARPRPLDPARYPFAWEIATRFADLDANQHLNNVALAAMLEDARVRFEAATGRLISREGLVLMVASLTIDDIGQGFYPAPVTVHVASTEVGRSSFGLVRLVRQDDIVVALARVVMVCIRDKAPFPLPGSFQNAVGPWILRP